MPVAWRGRSRAATTWSAARSSGSRASIPTSRRPSSTSSCLTTGSSSTARRWCPARARRPSSTRWTTWAASSAASTASRRSWRTARAGHASTAASTAPPSSAPARPSGCMEIQRGKYLRQTIASPIALIALVIFAGAAGIAGAIAVGGTVGAVAAAGAALFWFLTVLGVAISRANKAFYGAYAEQRGLQWRRDGTLPPATPLLRRGDSRGVDEMFAGTLPGGLDGELALYTYEERRYGGSGGQTDEIHHFTIVVSELPGLEARLPGLFVQRRSGFRFLDGAEDVFRRTERIELESEVLDRKCEIFADKSCDPNWLRQLFTPTFVDFLAESSPEGFAFEVENGTLCVNVNRHRGKAAELDEICTAAAAVAKRINEEAAE